MNNHKRPRSKTSTLTADNLLPLGLPQTPSDYIDIVRFRWPWIVATVIFAAVASQIVVRFVPARFVSRTIVLVETTKIPKDFIPQMNTDAPSDRLRTINEEILARPRVEKILEELKPYPELIDVPKADIVDLVRRRAAVGIRGRDAFVVEYSDTDPARAQRMAARLTSLFIEETTGARQRQVQGANEFIDSQLRETKTEMEKVELSLKQIKQRYMGMLPNQLEANLSTLQRLELERQSVAEQIRAAKDRKSLLDRQLSLQSQMNEPEARLIPDVPLSGVTSDSGAPAPNGSLAELKAYLAQLETRYTAQHPEVVATRARIERLEREQAQAKEASAPPPDASADPQPAPAPAPAPTDFLVSDLKAQIAAVDRDIQQLEDRQKELQSGIGQYQGRVEKIPEVEQELQSLERDYDLIGKYYSELQKRKLEAETADAVERKWKEDTFRVLDPAQVPDKPEFPKPVLFLLIGTMVGIGAGLALAFLFEVMDPAVKNMRELESLLPYPVLLTLPQVRVKTGLLRRRREPTPPPSLSTPTKVRQDLSA
jgi:polysaccharide chain length determinant protein (PEP-CTERM system associated)